MSRKGSPDTRIPARAGTRPGIAALLGLGDQRDRRRRLLGEEVVGEQPDRPRPDPPADEPAVADEDVEPPGPSGRRRPISARYVLLGLPGVELDEADRLAGELDDARGRRIVPGAAQAELLDRRLCSVSGRFVGVPPLPDVRAVPPGDHARVVAGVISDPPDDQVPVGRR